jgi:glycerol dehydrogenase
LLRAGIGDALTKLFEARATAAARGTNSFGARPPFLGQRLGAICREVIGRTAAPVLQALGRGERHADFEELVETLILASGLGFESGGLSVAHSMIRGLTRVPALAHWLHGEHVAYSTLVQLVLEGGGRELDEAIAFNLSVGLPAALGHFGVALAEVPAAAAIIAAGTLTAPYIGNFPRRLSEEDIAGAVVALEAIAHNNSKAAHGCP